MQSEIKKVLKKKWVSKTCPDLDKQDAAIDYLQAEFSLSKQIAGLLVQRGVTTKEAFLAFFSPHDIKALYDPFLMKDMDKAVDRLDKALLNNEKIIVFGDYDVDGTTAVAVLYSFLRDLDANLDFFIPDRFIDGYGLSSRGIDDAHKKGASLMICLDCGIKANEQVLYAKSLGIDIIICDHHRPGEILPDAVAILDPKREDCQYPYKELSGCGVGFKLAQAYAQLIGERTGRPKGQQERESVFPLLDLVAISIASDIVPITDENRIMAHCGLLLLNTQPRPSIETILYFSNIKPVSKNITDGRAKIDFPYFNRKLSISDLVFYISPRINAAGRIENGKHAVKLLLCNDLQEATVLSSNLNDINTERKKMDLEATEGALKIIKADQLYNEKKTTVVYNEEWSQGVIGIVASRLTETYYKPTIVFTKAENKDMLVGSARSVKGFDIYNAIEACGDFLEHFGGHKYAAGLSIKPEHLELFSSKFEEIVGADMGEEEYVPEIEIDQDLDFSDISPEFVQILKRFAPFGPKNTNPIFKTSRVKDAGTAKIVGGNHIKLSLFQSEVRSEPFEAIAFQQAHLFDKIRSGESFEICYQIEEKEWNRNRYIQLNVKDIHF